MCTMEHVLPYSRVGCMYIACPQHGDLRLSDPPLGQDISGGARTRNRRVPAELRADSLSTVPPTPPTLETKGRDIFDLSEKAKDKGCHLTLVVPLLNH
ncbi:hypothetical protein PoB_002989700 [Plakobranchus ocellatus]|uniref:Uncharacterized protein n=1 Tax=Plakobranchus ocellatus TaxID=259542 RepID=A0AAV4A8W9_9GAST|nr:hypothetical protein PoB_002989700 [Plakobranchus ocellatus]